MKESIEKQRFSNRDNHQDKRGFVSDLQDTQ